MSPFVAQNLCEVEVDRLDIVVCKDIRVASVSLREREKVCRIERSLEKWVVLGGSVVGPASLLKFLLLVE